MEKQKPWQLYLIIAVIVLTLYNILPTIFYYSKPLKEPINSEKAEQVSQEIVERVSSLESDSRAWIESFCKLLGIKPAAVQLDDNDPRLFVVSFNNAHDAALFKRFLPRAGALIPFVPAQLELAPGASETDPNHVYVTRQIGVRLQNEDIQHLFQFTSKLNEDSSLTDFYKQLVNDRAAQLAIAFGGAGKTAQQAESIVNAPSNDTQNDDLTIAVAKEIVDMEKTFGKNNPIVKRYFASFTQSAGNKTGLVQQLAARFDTLKSKIQKQQEGLKEEQKKAQEKQIPFDSVQQQMLSVLNNQYQALDAASKLIRENIADFNAGQKPLSLAAVQKSLSENNPQKPELQILSLQGRNPFVEALVIDWANDRIELKFYPDIQAIRQSETKTEAANYLKDKINQMVINDIARASRAADESITPYEESFAVTLNQLTNTQSLLALDLGHLAEKQSKHFLDQLKDAWKPAHPDLSREAYPVQDYLTFKMQKPEEQKLGLVVMRQSWIKHLPKDSGPISFTSLPGV